jgi:hypothetical protein
LKILHEKSNNLLGPFLHPLHIKIHLRPNLVLGRSALFRKVRIRIVLRATVPTSDDDPLPRLFLNIVQEINQNRINRLFTPNDRQAMPRMPPTIGEWSGMLRVTYIDNLRIERISLTAEKLLRNLWEIDLRFPRIGRARDVLRRGNGIKMLVMAPIDRIPFTIKPADLFPLRLLHPRTAKKKKEDPQYSHFSYSPV